ncbi:MAG TPA: polymer-forming cytoskeletal protein [Steroidobacteraceae bacterium]|nr:polymer-forming cytoskeletal protein [Steroidobacteraceae bacterium]HRX89499.1 polymer-forming cytoskeletal protein [Steroidobacteraceae bacterium]
MFGRKKHTNPRIDTLVGKSAKLVGDIEFSGGLHLDGRVVGNVRSAGDGKSSLSISEHGGVEGTVEAANVVLNGSINGDIFARERVVMGSQARVNGNVSYGIIEMAPGAVITGKLMPLSGAKAQQPVLQAPVSSSPVTDEEILTGSTKIA